MTKLVKKNKRISDKGSSSLIKLTRRNSVVALIFIFILLTLLVIGMLARNAAEADKNNAIKLRNYAAELVNRTNLIDENMIWKDDNSCVISRPNSVGEKLTYSCNVHYIHTHAIQTQADIDKLIYNLTLLLRDSADIVAEVDDESTGAVKISSDINANTYYTATSFVFKGVRFDKGVCYVRYVISAAKDSADVHIECSVGTKKAYFEPVRQI